MRTQILFTTFAFLFVQMVFGQTDALDLERLYRANPGLATQANQAILHAEALKILKDPAAVARIDKLVKGNLAEFNTARTTAISALRASPVTGLRPVVVSGQSVTGMVAAAIAAQSGHEVRVYDLRMNYTRDIQWSSRQSVPDLLASIDPQLAQRYNDDIAKEMSRGYLSFGDDSHNIRYPVIPVESPDPRRVPQIARDMLKYDDVATVQTRVFGLQRFRDVL